MKQNKKEVCAIILARSGSKGLKNKNLRDLDGKPLISYTINDAKKSKYIDKIIVSTDSEEIAKVANEFGAETPFLRPKELSSDMTTSEESGDVFDSDKINNTQKKRYNRLRESLEAEDYTIPDEETQNSITAFNDASPNNLIISYSDES